MRRVIFLLMISMFLAGPMHAEERVLRVGWDDYPPYQIDPQAELPGIDIEVVQQLARQGGYRVALIKMPWARQLLSLEDGSIDMALSASISEDRAGYATWTNPYRPERAALMALESTPARIPALRSLVGTSARIGVIRNSVFPGEYETLIREKAFLKQIEFTSTNISALHMLRAKRVSHVLDDPVAIDYLAKLHPGPKVVPVLTVMDAKAHLMLSKKSPFAAPDEIARLNSGIARLHKDGTLRQIFTRYGTQLP